MLLIFQMDEYKDYNDFFQIFNISRKIDWDKHFKNSWLGLKKFYFKEVPKEEVVAVEETDVLQTSKCSLIFPI